MKSFRANGKLLLTGEYVVLDGAKALALPTRLGQTLKISGSESNHNILHWKAFLHDRLIWFETEIDLQVFRVISSSDNDKSNMLLQILKHANHLNPHFFSKNKKHFECTTQLEFPKDWGLGSSSTLISLISQWTETNPYELLTESFGGSGYDLACAESGSALFFSLHNGKPQVDELNLSFPFQDDLFFLYLNQKQNSRNGIKTYRQKPKNTRLIKEISSISEKLITCKTLAEFETLIDRHEKLIGNQLERITVKENLFHEYSGSIKSLGAWGGDFVLVTKRPSFEDYFKQKGYEVLISFEEMIFKK